MPEDIYLRFEDEGGNPVPGLKGECMDDKHKGSDGWIQFKSLNFGFGFESKNATAIAKTTGPAAKPSKDTPAAAAPSGTNKSWGHSGALDFQRVSLSKNSDLTSTRLMEMCHGGEAVAKVIVEACRLGGENESEKMPFLRLTFENVYFRSCKLNLAVEGLPTETLEFEYDIIRMKSMWTDNRTGGKRTSQPIGAGWDLTKQAAAPPS
jgi:type VI protein secretion system component Hcp